MRIAQVAPLAEAVPPGLYGGTERVVSWLTEELVRQGHQVTLFASAYSEPSAPDLPRFSDDAACVHLGRSARPDAALTELDGDDRSRIADHPLSVQPEGRQLPRGSR